MDENNHDENMDENEKKDLTFFKFIYKNKIYLLPFLILFIILLLKRNKIIKL